MLAAVARDGLALQHAADELRADRAVVSVAVAQDGSALEYAADALRADRALVIGAVTQKGWALVYAAEALRADREVVLIAVRTDGWALVFAADELRADRAVVTLAVAQDGFALAYAADPLRADAAVVQAALESHPDAWRCVDADRKRLLRRRLEVRAARVMDVTAAATLLAQLAKRRPTSDEELDRLDCAIALIARRFPALQDAAQDASARLHDPWTTKGRWSFAHKRARAAFEREVRA